MKLSPAFQKSDTFFLTSNSKALFVGSPFSPEVVIVIAKLGRNSPIVKYYPQIKIFLLLPASTLPYVVKVKNCS
jgi:hypothetical protein